MLQTLGQISHQKPLAIFLRRPKGNKHMEAQVVQFRPATTLIPPGHLYVLSVHVCVRKKSGSHREGLS